MAGVAPRDPNQKIKLELGEMRTYVLMKDTHQWVMIQDQTTGTVEGGHFIGDLSGNRAVPMSIELQRDGIASMNSPPTGFNDHFWIAPRGTFAPGTVDGVYVQLRMRTTAADAGLIASVGADWWRDPSAEFVAGFSNNPSAGNSNWVVLGPNWTTLYFYSIPSSELKANPPPPLERSVTGADIQIPNRPTIPSICQPVERQPLALDTEQR